MGIETITWAEFPSGGKANVEQILGSKEINKSKRAGLWDSKNYKSLVTNTLASGLIEKTLC